MDQRNFIKKKALIIGVSGQDGYYLSRLLAEKNYEVHGTVRRTVCTTELSESRSALSESWAPITLHHYDLSDNQSCFRLIREIVPDEIYNLASQTHVQISFESPVYTADINGQGALRVLDAIKALGLANHVKYFQASSSEIFGMSEKYPQTELTPKKPRSPYGAAKLYAHFLTVNYRESYGMHASNGIMFNHESPRRKKIFASKKIARGAARIKLGMQKDLALGRLTDARDWGYAAEYVEAMWLMLQQAKPADYVIATNESHTVQEFCDEAFRQVGLDWKAYVTYDKSFDRVVQINKQQGDASKAKNSFGWSSKTNFRELIKIMVDHELLEAKREAERGK